MTDEPLTLETAEERAAWLRLASETCSERDADAMLRAYRKRCVPPDEAVEDDDDDWPSLGQQRLSDAIRAAMDEFGDGDPGDGGEYSHAALVEAWASMGRNSRTFAADQIARRVYASTEGDRRAPEPSDGDAGFTTVIGADAADESPPPTRSSRVVVGAKMPEGPRVTVPTQPPSSPTAEPDSLGTPTPDDDADELYTRMVRWLEGRGPYPACRYSKTSMAADVCPGWMRRNEAMAACDAAATYARGWPCGSCCNSGNAPFLGGSCIECDGTGRESTDDR